MREILFFVIAVILSIASFAQNDAVLYNFEDESDINDWTLGDDDESQSNWAVSNYDSRSGLKSAMSLFSEDVTSSHSLLSPEVSLTRDDRNGYFSFWVRGLNENENGRAYLKINVYVDGEFFLPLFNVPLENNDGWQYYVISFHEIPGLTLNDDAKDVQFEIVHSNRGNGQVSALLIDDAIFAANSETFVIQFDGGTDYFGDVVTLDMDFEITDDDGSYEVPGCDYDLDGYTFLAWYTQDDEGSYVLMEGDVIWPEMDLIFTAIWGRNYNVVYDANEGDGDMDSEDMVEMLPYVVPLSDFTRDGYTFVGWNTEDDGSGMAYIPGDTVYYPYDEDSNFLDTLTLYAQWQWDGDLELVFDSNGGDDGEIEISDTIVNIFNSGYRFPQCPYVYEDYHFVGWNTEYDGSGMSFMPGDFIRPIVDEDGEYIVDFVYIYAMWEENATLTISFETNVGEGEMDDTLVNNVDPYIIPECAFVYPGYVFAGWESDNDSVYVVGQRFVFPVDEDGDPIEEDIVLTATWRPLAQASFSFNANDGSAAHFDTVVTEGETFQIPNCYYTREGYSFAGWNTAADGSGTAYVAGSVYVFAMEEGVPVSQTIALYAQWTANEPDPEGISITSMPAVTVYPNPTANRVTVNGATVTEIEVISLEGRRCLSVKGVNTVDLGGLPNGVYMLRISTPQAATMRRIVKQ